MSKLKNRFISVAILGIIFVLFNTLLFVLSDLPAVGGAFWCAYAFTVIAFILTAIALSVIKMSKDAIFNTLIILYVVIGAYFGITLLTNIIVFAAFPYVDKVTATILINITVLLLSVAAFLIVYKAFSHITNDSKQTYQKVSNFRTLAVNVGALEYQTNDEAVKRAVRKLKENLSYSDPMSTESSAEIEENFKQQVEIIKSLLANGVDSQNVIEALNNADATLKTRNEIVRTSK